MDWHAAMDDERRMLKRIVAFLFFFAWLARLSCALPQSARGYVLGVLRRAETRVREFVLDMAEDHGVPIPAACLAIPTLHDLDSVGATRQLAQNFRALAILLDHLIKHYPVCRTGGIGGYASPFATKYGRAGNLLATLCQSLAGATGRQLRAAPMRLAFEPIDSS